ncbi:MAG: hypothetical protein KAI47_20185, partial [Deltaproteobacteria bacterium]|nr:hypothetical protein [Deltaproteobacteria bacterium]
GIRISFADATVPSKVTYRLLLLVEPTMNGTRADFKAIDIHAGGIAWVGRYLYVADTSRGLRVFDTGRILEVATTKNVLGYDSDTKKYYAYKYRYIVPQVGFYRQQSKCNPRFSFVALDRTSTPPALVSGEYASSSIAGRLFRWPVDLKTGKMPTGTFYPEKAYYLGKRQVQGAVSHGATTYLSSSQPPSGHGDLTGTTPGKRLFTDAWIDGSEDLVYDVTRGQLWGAGEARGKRYVFAVDAAKL